MDLHLVLVLTMVPVKFVVQVDLVEVVVMVESVLVEFVVVVEPVVGKIHLTHISSVLPDTF